MKPNYNIKARFRNVSLHEKRWQPQRNSRLAADDGAGGDQ